MKNKITILSLMLALTGCVTKVENTIALGGSDADVESSLLKEMVTNKTALDSQELLDLLPGSTVYQDKDDFVQVGFYAQDNTMTGNIWGSWEDQIDKGSWMVSEEGQFCNQWSGSWSKGDEENCYTIYPGEGEDQYLMVSDSDSNVSSFNSEAEMILITPNDTDEFE